jgi:hypothetical protein
MRSVRSTHASLILAVVLLCDVAMPLSPGAFRFQPEHALEVAWPVSIQPIAGSQLAAPMPRLAGGRTARTPIALTAPADSVRREEAASPGRLVSIRSPHRESEAPAAEDPPLPAPA